LASLARIGKYSLADIFETLLVFYCVEHRPFGFIPRILPITQNPIPWDLCGRVLQGAFLSHIVEI